MVSVVAAAAAAAVAACDRGDRGCEVERGGRRRHSPGCGGEGERCCEAHAMLNGSIDE
jgi:hypothetical protein